MSFLSRKPARPGGRGGDAGRDEYDDFDGYAHDGYQNEDDEWSPGEYFSPEGIKGRWAGEHPEGRAGGRGQRDPGRGEAAPYDSHGDDFSGTEYGSPSYGADEFTNGAYDLPDGADEDRPDRSRRRRKDREDRSERTGILRLRRDRGEDIWPDDGISDEDYWASVAADRPLNGTDSPSDSAPGGSGGPRTGTGTRPGMSGTDARFGGEQRGERGAAGRLGPPPGLSGDYQPGARGNVGAPGSASQPSGSGRTGSGPIPARPGTGPQSFRPGAGSASTVGVTASRPPAGQTGMRPGPAQPGTGSNGFPQAAARPSFQPNGYQPSAGPTGAGPTGGGPAGGRQQDRGEWGDRTERIERVTLPGYPDSRPSGRSQVSGTSGGPGNADSPGRAAGFGTGTSGAPSYSPAPGRGRTENASWPPSDHREPDRRDPSRDSGRETSGSWPTAARGAHARGAADDDPLTSQAYSRSALTETDGRSYRAAARRSQSQTKLTEHTETFITGQYQQSSQYQSGGTGEYWSYRDDTSYRDDAPTTITQAPRYPAPGGQAPGNHQAQAGRSTAGPGPGQGPGHATQPGQSSGRHAGPPAGSLQSVQHDAAQPRPSQQQRQQPQLRQPQSPATGLTSAASGNATPGSVTSGSPAGTRPTGNGGLNPYDSVVTGSYPYVSQPYASRPASAGAAQDADDDRYYRPSPQDGYAVGGAGPNRTDQGRTGYGNGYPAAGDRRR